MTETVLLPMDAAALTRAAAIPVRLLPWFDLHGRHDLPWQHPRDAYRVWVSEIMLQQTQVATVIPYFQRFMASFPDLAALADAPEDAVLAAWAGLGYYSRARHLHRAAKAVAQRHQGALPNDFDALVALPGIGHSTAGAILALAYDRRFPILDGNVKRVLTRYFGIDGWPGAGAVEKALWTLADAATPAARVADYTQAIMDLGATVCIRSRPVCAACPLAADCRARIDGRTAEIPARRPRRAKPERATIMLAILDAERRILLERRPPSGVWGGLWSLPEVADETAAATFLEDLALNASAPVALTPIRHTFTHFVLTIAPLLVRCETARDSAAHVAESDIFDWCRIRDVVKGKGRRGVPAPVARLLAALESTAIKGAP